MINQGERNLGADVNVTGLPPDAAVKLEQIASQTLDRAWQHAFPGIDPKTKLRSEAHVGGQTIVSIEYRG